MTSKDRFKMLFITFNDISNSNFGGAQCSRRNYKMLSEFGDVKIYIVSKRSGYESLKSAFKLLFPPYSLEDKLNILKLLREDEYTHVFIDSSLLGNVVCFVNKYFKIPTLTFFHNVEVDYINVRFGKKIIRLPYKFLAWINEKMSIKYSDKIIALNFRDEQRIKELYKRNPDIIIPITFEIKITKNELLKKYKREPKLKEKMCLFIGALSNPNFEGIKWFVEKVADNICTSVKIVGNGFDQKEDELRGNNVEVVGYVESLEKYYLQADCIISPLLSGAGMKVKIAEALMYGKTIFGTTESFEGYEVEYDKLGGLCNTAEEFIEKINKYMNNSSKYNEYSRQVFEEKYTDDVALDKFKQALIAEL